MAEARRDSEGSRVVHEETPVPAAGGGGNQGVVNAIGGGIVSGLAGLVDGILNSPADLVAMEAHTSPAYHVNLSGAWDSLWESRTGIQPGSPNDWLLHEISTATSIATLLIPGIDAASGTADTLRGLSETRALADGLTTTTPKAAGGLSEAFHYTRAQNVASIEENGLRAGSYATPNGDLSSTQAQIDLALPPNRGLPGVMVRVDVAGLRRAGYNIPEINQVGRSFNMPGGGEEMQFPYPIPPEFLKVIAP